MSVENNLNNLKTSINDISFNSNEDIELNELPELLDLIDEAGGFGRF